MSRKQNVTQAFNICVIGKRRRGFVFIYIIYQLSMFKGVLCRSENIKAGQLLL